MKVLGHIASQPFVFTTGLAALAHSTWALATLFAGEEPIQFTVAWFAWLIPALLIAFALDVGQIVTSAEIRAGQKRTVKYVTFAVFALATYFLQWLYMVHHVPALELSDGVRSEWSFAVTLIRDCSIWVIPALLPLSTLLYTFSTEHPTIAHETHTIAVQMPTLEGQSHDTQQTIITEEQQHDEPVLVATMPITATCEKCGWTRNYTSELSAQRGLAGHKCKANDYNYKQNGHYEEVKL